jgi:hypothetical protein
MSYSPSPEIESGKTYIALVVFSILWITSAITLFATAKGQSLDQVFYERFVLYTIEGIAGAVYFIAAANINKSKRKVVLHVPIHDPNEAFPFLRRVWLFRNPFMLALSSLGFFMLVFGLVNIVSPAQSVFSFGNWYSDTFVSLSENIAFAAILSWVISLVYKLTGGPSKNGRAAYWLIMLFFVPVLIAYVWLMYHNAVYGANEEAQAVTFLIGWLWTIFTIAFYSMIPWGVLHPVNNSFKSWRTTGFFGNEWNVVYVTLFIIVVNALVILISKARKAGLVKGGA